MMGATDYATINKDLYHPLNLNTIHPSWLPCIAKSLLKMDQNYLALLENETNWLPGKEKIFNAFSEPLDNLKFILFGESPYPRQVSANGYAFWDDSVLNLWSETGLDKKVNRATSLRNIIKMLLVAGGHLPAGQTTQENIATLDKSNLVQTSQALFQRLLDHGFLLLNATPVLHPRHIMSPSRDAKAWTPFMHELLMTIIEKKPDVCFLLLGNIAGKIDKILGNYAVKKIYAEHPYNISFITNPIILNFFAPLQLLEKQ